MPPVLLVPRTSWELYGKENRCTLLRVRPHPFRCNRIDLLPVVTTDHVKFHGVWSAHATHRQQQDRYETDTIDRLA